MTRLPRTVFSVWLLAVAATAQAVTVVPLNDTGQTLCYDSASATISCASSGFDDGRYGRDAGASAGRLTKIGAGAAGFDFSKIANNGSVLTAGVALGSNPTDWACNQDNVTGLIWEVKTTSGLRSGNHGYTWYSADTASNGGNAGDLGSGTGTCSSYQCNTANYVAAVNATSLCGYSDWRLPRLRELQSLVNFAVPAGSLPTIDAIYFPNTQTKEYWTADNYSFNPVDAWHVKFFGGMAGATSDKTYIRWVRLVRGEQ